MATLRFSTYISLLVGYLLACPAWGAGLEESCVVRVWTSKDGLPLDRVRALAQTPDGFLWVATFNGLARFDGSRFEVFQINNTPELPNNLINALFCDRQGRLWIGHDTGQITLLQGRHFRQVALPSHWPHRPVHCFGDDAQGTVWALDSGWRLAGLLRDGKTVQFAAKGDSLLNLCSGAADGILRATTVKGHCYLVRSEGLFPDPDEPPEPADGKQLMRSSRGGYWVVRENRLERWTGQQRVQDLGEVDWGESIYVNMCEWGDKVVEGTFWKGVHLAGPNHGRGRFQAEQGLPSASITALLVDRDQTLWEGTSKGLVGIWPKRVQTLSPPSGGLGHRIQSLAPAPQDGVWVSTEDAGLFQYGNSTWQRVAGLPQQFRVLTSLWQSPESNLWVGSSGKGLGHLSSSPSFVTINSIPLNSIVRSILVQATGTVWVGTANELFRLSGPDFTRAEPVQQGEVFSCLEEDGQGGIWFGTKSSGLGHWSSRQITYIRQEQGLPSESVCALHRTSDGALWVGTDGAGLVRLRQKALSVVSGCNGLPNDTICQINEDNVGRLWLGTYAGVCAVALSELNACAEGGTPK